MLPLNDEAVVGFGVCRGSVRGNWCGRGSVFGRRVGGGHLRSCLASAMSAISLTMRLGTVFCPQDVDGSTIFNRLFSTQVIPVSRIHAKRSLVRQHSVFAAHNAKYPTIPHIPSKVWTASSSKMMKRMCCTGSSERRHRKRILLHSTVQP